MTLSLLSSIVVVSILVAVASSSITAVNGNGRNNNNNNDNNYYYNNRNTKNIQSPNPKQPENPIIAIVTSPLEDCNAYKSPLQHPHSCVDGFYHRWLSAQGVRMVPLQWDAPFAQKKKLLDKVNGVLLPGGSLSDIPALLVNYTRHMQDIVEYGRQNPDFFIWGTCQGFQVLSVILGNMDNSICPCSYHGMYPLMMSLNFTAAQPNSIMFGKNAVSPINIVHLLRTQNTTLNYHNCGISPHDFIQSGAARYATVLSTNEDPTGKPFVSSWEYKDNKLNMFATQFHPERPSSDFGNDKVGHSPAVYQVSTYLAKFVHDRLQRNSHTFGDQSAANAVTVDQYTRVYYGWGKVLYWFDAATLAAILQ